MLPSQQQFVSIVFILFVVVLVDIPTVNALSENEDIQNNSTVAEDYYNSFTFSQDFLQLTYKAVHLSALAYDNDPISSSWDSFQYDTIDVFNENEDQAVLVKVDDYCMVAFRGTDTTSWGDIYQNFMFSNTPVCSTASSSANICCNAESGFYDAYHSSYRIELENSIRFCASQCTSIATTNPNAINFSVTMCPTVVLTGHSQGGSIATIASIYLSDLSPTIITFGEPPTIEESCPLIDESRIYRFENSRIGRRGTTYDPVPYVPNGARQYGHQIMLGDDASGVAYIRSSSEIEFGPWDAANFFATHRLTSDDVGYRARINALVNANRNVPYVRTSGFVDGTVCSKAFECASQICYNERCITA
jgi:Lipase (class 3)